MSTFTIDMSSPFPSGSFTRGLGGPNSGGHHGADWYIRFGMDLGAPAGTEVHAAFDGHITVLHPHNPAKDSAKVYGRKSSCGSRLRRPRRASQTIRWAASIPTSPMCRVRSTSGHGSAGGICWARYTHPRVPRRISISRWSKSSAARPVDATRALISTRTFWTSPIQPLFSPLRSSKMVRHRRSPDPEPVERASPPVQGPAGQNRSVPRAADSRCTECPKAVRSRPVRCRMARTNRAMTVKRLRVNAKGGWYQMYVQLPDRAGC
jgi:hypothetical protein